MPSQRVKVPILLFTLKCGHLGMDFANTAKTELRCIFHNEDSPITGVHVHEWNAKCRRCSFSRWTGMSKDNARGLADKHARTHPSHAPAIFVQYVVRPEAREEHEKRLANALSNVGT